MLLHDVFAPFPFLTFFPAIILAALLAGMRPAILVAAASLMSAWYFFTPAYNSFAITGPGLIGVSFFALVAAIDIALIELLHRALARGRAERARTEALLTGREAMFKELQHRVANNMQFLSSLLAMQRRQVDGAAAEALDQAIARLRAMSRVHRRLYDPANAERPFAQLMEELCQEVIEATGAHHLTCRVDVSPVALPPDRVHALAMIATEAMTNAVKHAFPERRAGTIQVRLVRAGDRQFEFRVIDDGIGLPAGFDPAASPSLGLKIMQALAQQIGGQVSFQSAAEGAEVRLLFSL